MPHQPRTDPLSQMLAIAARRATERLGKSLAGAGWIYLGLAVVVWVFVLTAGDRWWVGTLFLFGPRWLLWAPLVILAPAACLWRLRSLPVLTLAAAIVLFGVMGLRSPLKLPGRGSSSAFRLRVLTCNVHHNALDPGALAFLIAENSPDVVVLQEWHPALQRGVFGAGWHCRTMGEQFLASRYPIAAASELEDRSHRDLGFAVLYELQSPAGVLPVFSVHTASPHLVFEALLRGDPSGVEQVRQNIATRRRESEITSQAAVHAGDRVVLAGDFNLSCESAIYRRSYSRFSDAFSEVGSGFGYTYYTGWNGVRIDHVLTGAAWKCTRVRILPGVGSQHRPLLADLELVRG